MVPSRPCGHPSKRKRRRVQVSGQTTLTAWCASPTELPQQSETPTPDNSSECDLVLSDVRGDVSQPELETGLPLNLEGVRGPAVVRRNSLLDWDMLWDETAIPPTPEQSTILQLFNVLPLRLQNLYIMPLDERHSQMTGRALVVRQTSVNDT